jgi:predicted ABC-type ATPase
MILVLAGPNGSGKTTITQYFEKVGEYTNADDVVASTGMSNEDAARFVDKKRYDAISEKRDFTFETVLSSDYKLEILRKAKEEGYFIKCVFVLTVDPIINVARVEARVAQGGHNVARDKIISRYEKSLANIKELLEICDILHVYDNTIEPKRIIRKHKEDISVFANDLWSEEQILLLMNP